MTLQRGSIFGMVLLKKRVTDQELRPVCRDSPGQEQREVPGPVWID